MSIVSGPFTIMDYEKDCFRIKVSGQLTGAEAALLRMEVAESACNGYDVIYLDAKEVTEMDLSGINEVINSHYTLDKASKKLIFLYKKDSPVESWVATTALDKFVATAIVPAS
ncbi:hypothetical protein [Rudanella lutea]|uniref:hypothetical protein n=1 Tax=Rudanella lutea TaxID=451374 RepID=UPI00037BBE9A|nr:hypothetical protein [Rudanella lutea]